MKSLKTVNKSFLVIFMFVSLVLTDFLPVFASSTQQSPYQKFIFFDFPSWIIGIVLLVILFAGVKFSKIGEWQENPLALDKSKCIQGFCAIAIIIHHWAQEVGEKAGILWIFSEFGVIFVGVFFFFSGYGLYTSLKTKENYLKGFLKKRLVTVLIPFYVCIIVFTVAACMTGKKFPVPKLIETLTGWILINSHMWYIVEIAVLYLAFFLIYRFVKNRALATGLMSFFVLILTIGSLLLAHGEDLSSKYWFMGEWWYNTTFAFVFGIIVSQNQEKLRAFARRFYILLLPLFGVLTCLFSYLSSYAIKTWSYWNEYPGHKGYKEKFMCLGIQLPWVIFFVIFVILVMMRVRFGNPVLKFIGSISLELYLLHNLFLTELNNGKIFKINGSSFYVVLTILFSIVLAWVINGVDKYLIRFINGKKAAETKLTDSGTKERIHSIDVMRIVMSFLVVTIHIPFKGTAGKVFISFGKIAVPFFLVVSGYMLYRNECSEMMPRLKKQALKMLIFYVAANVVYAAAQLILAYVNNERFYINKENILNFLFFNFSPFSEHLWFLGSALYALLILMLLCKLKAINKAMFAAPVLIIAYVILSTCFADKGYAFRNAILVGLPYMMMGMMIRRFKDKMMNIKAPVLWIVTVFLCVAVIFEMNFHNLNTDIPFVSCEVLVYAVMFLCLKYPDFGKNTFAEKMGRDLSLPIYIIHILVLMFIPFIIPMSVGAISNYGAVTVFVISALAAGIYKWGILKGVKLIAAKE